MYYFENCDHAYQNSFNAYFLMEDGDSLFQITIRHLHNFKKTIIDFQVHMCEQIVVIVLCLMLPKPV